MRSLGSAFGGEPRLAFCFNRIRMSPDYQATPPSGGPPSRPVKSGAEAPHSKDLPHSKDWPHAPVHRLSESGTFMVTAGTSQKAHLLHSPARLTLVRDALFAIATEYHWQLQAWAILGNHYHFIAHSPADPRTLTRVINKLHATTAKSINQQDAFPGRKVWFQYWDTRVTFESSLLARLRYVHTNPVHHGVAITAESYPWCSAAWLETHAAPAFRRTLATFKTDHLAIPDDF